MPAGEGDPDTRPGNLWPAAPAVLPPGNLALKQNAKQFRLMLKPKSLM